MPGSPKSSSSVSESSSSSGPSSSSSSSSGPSCTNCTGTPPATAILTITGVADHPAGCGAGSGNDGDCATYFNDDFLLEFVADCDLILGHSGTPVDCGYYFIGDLPCYTLKKFMMFVWFGPGDRVSLEMRIAAQTEPCEDWVESENSNYVYGTGDGTCSPGAVVLDDYRAVTGDFRLCSFGSATFTVNIA